MATNIYFTKGVHERAYTDPDFMAFVLGSMDKFADHDWGDLCKEDCAVNEEALKFGDRLLGTYTFEEDGTKIWIIADAEDEETHNRTVTVLFPKEY